MGVWGFKGLGVYGFRGLGWFRGLGVWVVSSLRGSISPSNPLIPTPGVVAVMILLRG